MSGKKNKDKPSKKAYKKNAKHKKRAQGMMTRFLKNDPFKPKDFKRLTYSGVGSLGVTSVTAAPSASLAFTLNDPYDPYLPLTPATLNTKALGMTELAAIYNRLKVHAVEVSVTFYDPQGPAGTITDGLVACCLVNNPSNLANTMVGTDYGKLAKLPMTWVKQISDYGSQRVTFKQYFMMYQLFGLTHQQFKNDIENTTQPTNGSPASKAELEIGIADSHGRNTACICQFKIEINYFVELYQRVELALT